VTADTHTATIFGLDPGSLPAWLSLVAGVAAGSIALRNLIHDRRDRRTSQAGKVAAWMGSDQQRDFVTKQQAPGPMGMSFPTLDVVWSDVTGAYLRNASELPVRDVQLDFHRGGEIAGITTVGLLPPSSEPEFHAAPGGADEVALRFRDARDRLWERDVHGRLTERPTGTRWYIARGEGATP
jgi:hypothetical protein